MRPCVQQDGLTGLGIPEPASAESTSTALRLLTWNLRYDSQPDHIPVSETLSRLPTSVPPDEKVPYYADFSENPWSTRRIAVAREVAFHRPDLIGFQEALKRQVDDLATLLGDEFAHIGVGRDDGQAHGEYEAIFYRRSALTLLEWDTFWLSKTPFQPSKFPGAGTTRTATRALFRTRVGSGSDGGVITAICTHWDDRSDAQRQLAASLLIQRGAHEAVCTGNRPVFILGDFNSPSSGPDCGGYETITGARTPQPIDSAFAERYGRGERGWAFNDLLAHTQPMGRSGNHATFTGFFEYRRMDLKRIDFVMAGGDGWEVVHYRVGEDCWDAQRMASDHRPVWVDVVVKEEAEGREG